MPRLPRVSVLGLFLIAVVFGPVGIGLIRLGIEERVDLLVEMGAGFTGAGLAAALLGIALALSSAVRRIREVGRRQYREHRRVLRPLLLGAVVVLGLAAIVVTHNYIVWSRVERDCELALRTEDAAEAARALNDGLTAMQNPLLVIPSDLLDLWGPNRCRSAAEGHHLPLADPAAHGTDTPPPASSADATQPER